MDREIRDMTEQMKNLAQETGVVTKKLQELTQNTVDDSAVVSIITIASAIYLPGSFVGVSFPLSYPFAAIFRPGVTLGGLSGSASSALTRPDPCLVHLRHELLRVRHPGQDDRHRERFLDLHRAMDRPDAAHRRSLWCHVLGQEEAHPSAVVEEAGPVSSLREGLTRHAAERVFAQASP